MDTREKMNTLKWSDLRATLPPGLCDEAIEAIRVATAPARAAARRRAAVEAALVAVGADDLTRAIVAARMGNSDHQWALSVEPTAEQATTLLAAWTLCVLDGAEGGGPYWRGNPPSARLPWASALGKGRRYASDGEAWSAAIRDAGEAIRYVIDGASGAQPTPADLTAALAVISDEQTRETLRAYARVRIYLLAADGEVTSDELRRWSALLSSFSAPSMLRDLAAEGRITLSAIISQED